MACSSTSSADTHNDSGHSVFSMLRAALLSLVVCLAGPCWSETLLDRVVGVTDGDTIAVLDGSTAQHKIRLAGIDAPEKKQAYGEVSKQSLARVLFGKQVIVEWHKRHRGRLVGTVPVDGSDAGLHQLQHGLAWHSKAMKGTRAPPIAWLISAQKKQRVYSSSDCGETASDGAMGI